MRMIHRAPGLDIGRIYTNRRCDCRSSYATGCEDRNRDVNHPVDSRLNAALE